MIAIFFKTYGCQANVADSEGLIKYLESLGCRKVETEQEADLIVVNTCAIREKAEDKLFSYLGELAPLKKIKPYLKIGVIGCVASYRKKELYQRFDHVSFVFGAKEEIGALQTYLFDLLTRLETTKQLFVTDPHSFMDFGGQDRFLSGTQKRQAATLLPIQKTSVNTGCLITEEPEISSVSLGGIRGEETSFRQSFINITSGCNNYCTYCIVPFTRGREKSYPIKTLLERVSKDVAEGAKEINLVGQNVNSYCCPETGKGFAHLLEAVAHISGQFWVRYVSPHPKDMTRDVLETMAAYPEKLCGWVHFPLQSGSNKILEAMNRTYTAEEYLAQVQAIRDILPDATISTDIIVGFPGESDEDYQATRRVMELVRYDFTFSFIYSRRQYTKAYAMGDTCPEEIKTERLARLQERQKEIGEERNNEMIGKTVKVLIEKRLTNGRLLARTAGNIRVLIDANDEYINQFAYVTVQNAGRVNLEGTIVDSSEKEVKKTHQTAA